MSAIQYSRDYNSLYDPAIPIAEIILVNPETGERSGRFVAIIDSGADTSLIPFSLLQQINVSSSRKVRKRGVGGISQIMQQFSVGIEIGRISIWGASILADKSSKEAIIGRDVLNQLVVTLNGHAQVTEISA